MNIKFYRIGNSIMIEILNICGFSFTSAMTRGYSALFKVKSRDNFIRPLFQKVVYQSPVMLL